MRIRLALLPVVLGATFIVATGPAQAQPSGRIALVAQPSWIGAGGRFDLALQVSHVSNPASLEVAVTIYQRLTSRSAFALTLEDRISGSPIAIEPKALTDLTPDRSGRFIFPIGIRGTTPDPTRLSLRSEGVYPVRVELRERGGGETADHFTTHLVYLPDPHVARLKVAWVLPFHAPPALQPDGGRRPAAAAAAGLSDLAAALTPGSAPLVPVSVAPTPETLEAVQGQGLGTSASIAACAPDSARPSSAVGPATTSPPTPGAANPPTAAARDTLDRLRRGVAEGTGRQVIVGPYVPINLPALYGSRLDCEVRAELDQGAEATAQVLPGTRVGIFRTWVGEEPLNPAAIDRLQALGYDRLVVPDANLSPTPSARLTPDRPFLLEGSGSATTLPAAVADDGLASHFIGGAEAVLQAHQFLADLAQVFFEQPNGAERGVVVLTPRSWTPSAGFLRTAFDGLASAPVLDPVTLDTLFSTTPFATMANPRGHGTVPLVRHLADPMPATPADGSYGHDSSVRTARPHLAGFVSLTDPTNPLAVDLSRRFLIAESADLRTSSQRYAYIETVDRVIGTQFSGIQPPPSHTITLTAQTGKIPLTFRRRLSYTVHVLVRLHSEKLLFPGHTGDDIEALDLIGENTTERVEVLTRTSGTFPLFITLSSLDGNLRKDRPTRLTIRSTSTSAVGLALTGGAALFLVVWWGRHAVRRRRGRRAAPA